VNLRHSPLSIARPRAAVHIRWSERADGDFHPERSAEALAVTRRQFVDLPWTQLDEVHGASVLVVDRPGAFDGVIGDALVTELDDTVLGIWVGDCAPVALVSDTGVVGAVHAGWKGIERGVLQATVATMRRLGCVDIEAVVGPCIHPCCYEFGATDLHRLADLLGGDVVARTSEGAPALDVVAAVRSALGEVGVVLDDRSACTACEADRFYSHRARRDTGRQVMAVWRTATADGAVA
jgi:YfiH family protein